MTSASGDRPRARDRWREELRTARRQAFLDAARAIVTSDGQAALTMQRVTEAVGTSEGSIYHYFGSKTVLLGELEIHAVEALSRAFTQGQQNLQVHLDAMDASPQLRSLAHAVGSARFWIAAEATLPNEVELSRRIYTQPDTLDEEQVGRVLAAALAFLQLGAGPLDDAVEHQVLEPGNNVERSLLALASIAGALLTSRLDTWDAGLFDGKRMATDLARYLFTGWGAPGDLLAEADAVLDALSDEQLAPSATASEPGGTPAGDDS